MEDQQKALDAVLSKLKKIEEKRQNMSEDEKKELNSKLLNFRNHINPLSKVPKNCDKGYLCFSVIPMQRDYERKFAMTSLIAFLNRMADEWLVPENVEVVPIYDALRDPTLLDNPEPAHADIGLPEEIKQAYEENRNTMFKRIIVKEFLEFVFGFDPDRHVRSAYTPNKEDTSRKIITSSSAELAALINQRRISARKDASLTEKDEANNMLETIRDSKSQESQPKTHIMTVLRKIKGRDGKTITVQRKIRCTEEEFKANELLNKEKHVIKNTVDFKDYFDLQNQIKDQTLNETVRDLIPPSDLFHKLIRYIDTNYESLLQATNDIYAEKANVDWIINAYKQCKDMDEVDKFRQQSARDISLDMHVAQMGKYVVCGSYKENRENTSVENIPILAAMVRKNKDDRKIADELVKNRVRIQRNKNKEKHGDIDPNFSTYAATQEALNKALQLEPAADDIMEVQDDEAVEIPIIRISKGGKNIEISNMYTQAEAPDMHTYQIFDKNSN
jgi:hypothetical protein